MGSIFSPPNIKPPPPPPAPPPPPKYTDQAVKDAQAMARRQAAAAYAANSTILTSPQGLTTPANTAKTLLGT